MHKKPAVILDVAHNADGMKQLAEQIELSTYNDLYIIIGMVKDKDVLSALQYLPKTASYYFTKPDTPRALPESQMAEIAAGIGLQGRTFGDVNTALQEVLTHAGEGDLILVCGSVFLVGEVSI